MEDKQTLHSYLYGTLQNQIVSGKLRHGERLPSWSQLSTLYNVGIRTVKDVMRALQRDGYIATEKRKNAVVLYQNENSPQQRELSLQALLAKSASLLDAAHVMETVFPSIIARCVPLCDEEDVRQLYRITDSYSSYSEKELSRVASMALQRILQQYRNPLMTDLFIDVELYIRVPILNGALDFFDRLSEGAKERLYSMADLVQEGDAEEIKRRLAQTFGRNKEEIARYIAELAASGGKMPEHPETVEFHWNVEKGRLFGYTYVVRDLIRRMLRSEYEDGEFLPSAAQLSADYAVSLVTIRKALSVLGALGVVRSINGKGTQVTLREAADRRLWDTGGEEIKREVMLYLYALQMIAVLCADMAKDAFESITPGQIARLESRIEEGKSLMLPAPFLSCIIESLRSQVLRDIGQGLLLLLEWGQCLAFSSKNWPVISAAAAQSRILLEKLRAGDKQAFCEGLEDLYSSVFVAVRKKLTELGCTQAAEIPLPPDR